VQLLAALGVAAAQTEVGAKTNEIPMIIPLLDGLDLDRAVITADALHCQRATADYVHGRGADGDGRRRHRRKRPLRSDSTRIAGARRRDLRLEELTLWRAAPAAWPSTRLFMA